MKKKYIIICAIVLVAIAGIITAICLLKKNNDINYTKLEEDKKSIQESTTIVNAKKVDSEYSAKQEYKGEGYYIIILQGGDIVTYTIYDNNDKELWHYEKYYPMTNNY